jgi:hypothetical protein
VIDEREFYVISGGALLIVAISIFGYRAITPKIYGQVDAACSWEEFYDELVP